MTTSPMHAKVPTEPDAPPDTLDAMVPPGTKEEDVPDLTITATSRPLTHFFYLEVVVVVTVFAFIPPLAFIMGFSAIGYGEYAFKSAKEREESAYYLLSLSFTWWLITWCIDADLWTSVCAVRMRKVLNTLFLLAVVVGVVLSAGDYPYGPLCLFMVLYPVYLFNLYFLPFIKSRASRRQYMGTLPVPLTLVSFLVFAVWVIWILSDEKNEWNNENRVTLAEKVECEVTDDDNVDDPSYASCLDAFMLWVTPLAISACSFLFGLFGYFIDEKESHRAPKAFGTMLMFLMFGLWCAASLSGAGTAITSAFLAFVMAGLMALGVMLVSAFGVSGLAVQAGQSEFVHQMTEKYGAYADWIKALFVVCLMPLVSVYLFLAFVNQQVRACGMCGAKKLEDPEEKKLWITTEAHKRMQMASKWEWASVLVKALIWGMVFMILNVIVAKFIIVFLSWLIEFCADVQADAPDAATGMFYVTGVIIFVGLILFGLPCVPGVPIYLTGGIILVAAGSGVGDDDEAETANMGVLVSIGYTCIVGLVLKLFACACQQCLIGVPLKGWVSIRQMVAINSTMIRSMKLVLQRPGLDLAKVAILVGGPDWPTSVLCGILGLPLWPILIGTIPVFALIVPTVLSGSFLYLGSLGGDMYSWCETMATIMAAATAGVQAGSMLAAAYYLEKVAVEQADELAAMPFDEEVLRADAVAAAKIARYYELRQWAKLNWCDKFILVFGVSCMSLSCYIVQLFPGSCFEDFELTDTISDKLDGDVTNFVTTLGRSSMILFLMAVFLYYFFEWVMQRKLASSLRRDPLPPPPPVGNSTSPLSEAGPESDDPAL